MKKDTEIVQAIQELESDYGRLTPEIVLDAARDADSPLHACFEWDNDKAAEQHRLNQARKLIQTVKIRVVTESRTIASVKYVRDPSAGKEQGYVSVPQLQREPVNAARVLTAELDRVLSCLRRAEQIAEAVGMQERISGMIRELLQMRDVAAARSLP